MANERPCAFCDRTQFEEQIVTERENFYVVATLGQITNGGYTLLFPKRHVSCIGAMEFSEIAELVAEATILDQYVSAEYKCYTTIFEHGIVGQSIKHAHLYIVAAACMITPRIQADFPGKEVDIVSSLSDIKRLYQQKQKPYLFWNDYLAQSMICWDPPAPPQYLRKVVAEYLRRPERANWREMDAELDKKLWSETVLRLKKYY